MSVQSPKMPTNISEDGHCNVGSAQRVENNMK